MSSIADDVRCCRERRSSAAILLPSSPKIDVMVVCLSVDSGLRPLNEDRRTGHGRIREADAAHAMSSPFLSTTCEGCNSDGESR